MRKHRTRKVRRKARRRPEQQKGKKQLSLVGTLLDAKAGLRELVIHTGLEVFQASGFGQSVGVKVCGRR